MKRQRIDLEQAIRRAGGKWVDGAERTITYDPSMKPQYKIRRQSAHDGTHLFSIELMRRALATLADGSSYYVPDGWDEGMRYVVGPIKVITSYGMVNVPAGQIDGMRERVVIPVRAIKRASQ